MKIINRLIINHILAILANVILISNLSYGAETGGFLYMDLDPAKQKLQKLVNETAPGIVTVIAYDNTGTETGRGSGFFIDREGRIITNAFVMKGAYSAEIISENNNYKKVAIDNLNKELDAALIQVKAEEENPLDLDYDFNVRTGDRVFIIGRTASSQITFSEGEIISIVKSEMPFEYIEVKKSVSLLAYPDSKNGPLINSSGKVIGVTRSVISDHPIFDKIISISDDQEFHAQELKTIKSVLSEKKETKRLQPAGSKEWYPWLKKQTKTIAINTFITLYQMGFPKLMALIFMVIVLISIMQWLFLKLKQLVK